MSEKMREEFEGWYAQPWPNDEVDAPLLDRDGEGDYLNPYVYNAWEVWQAARESIVVTLPPTITAEEAAVASELAYEDAINVAHMVNGAIAACGAFIKAAGVKIKSS